MQTEQADFCSQIEQADFVVKLNKLIPSSVWQSFKYYKAALMAPSQSLQLPPDLPDIPLLGQIASPFTYPSFNTFLEGLYNT